MPRARSPTDWIKPEPIPCKPNGGDILPSDGDILGNGNAPTCRKQTEI